MTCGDSDPLAPRRTPPARLTYDAKAWPTDRFRGYSAIDSVVNHRRDSLSAGGHEVDLVRHTGTALFPLGHESGRTVAVAWRWTARQGTVSTADRRHAKHVRSRRWDGRQVLPLLLIGVLLLGGQALAGGGPENVLIVVNPLQLDSLTIANHYCHLRQIHSVNVVHLPWAGSRETIDIQTFRNAILQPIFAEIGRRRLERQIDYIVYSSGFPYAVDFSADPKVPLPPDPQLKLSGRHNGLTHRLNLPARARPISRHVVRVHAGPTAEQLLREPGDAGLPQRISLEPSRTARRRRW